MRSLSCGWLDALELLEQAPDPLEASDPIAAGIARRAYIDAALQLMAGEFSDAVKKG